MGVMERRQVTARTVRLSDEDEVDTEVLRMAPEERLALVFRLSRMNWNDDAGPGARLQRHVVRLVQRGR